ncbi:hypothetical protein U1Q18_037731 [Sarracenia purpurea var. burkii]
MPIIQTHCYRNSIPAISASNLHLFSISATHLRPNAFPTFNSFFVSSSTVDSTFLRLNPRHASRIFPRARAQRRRISSIVSAGSDYYSILNVGRSASLQEIKASYRKLARKVGLGCI